MLSERYAVLDQPRLGWIRIPLRNEHDEYRIYAELVTKHDNPRLPDRPDRMKEISEEQMADPRSLFGVTKAVLHDCEELPKDELGHLLADPRAGTLPPAWRNWPPATLRSRGSRWRRGAREAPMATRPAGSSG